MPVEGRAKVSVNGKVVGDGKRCVVEGDAVKTEHEFVEFKAGGGTTKVSVGEEL